MSEQTTPYTWQLKSVTEHEGTPPTVTLVYEWRNRVTAAEAEHVSRTGQLEGEG